MYENFKQKIATVLPQNFETLALEIFYYQAQNNEVYNRYLNCLNIDFQAVRNIEKIPFLPIQFFKNHKVLTHLSPSPERRGGWGERFESSGTTGQTPSRHFVQDLDWYKNISQQIFENSYKKLENCHFFALLPSYLERKTSSLIFMVKHFVEQSGSELSGFFLYNIDELLEKLKKYAENLDQKLVVLWGVTFALLDLAESGYDLSFLKKIPNLVVMETGGMKGRRQELLRQEVHEILTKKFGVKTIHSEYGMTELLSQAYSKEDGVFEPSATLRVLLRDINDPFAVYSPHDCPFRYGGVNVIDLANVDSCSFIETQDLGCFVGQNGDFEIIGRFDNSDIRGCNLMT